MAEDNNSKKRLKEPHKLVYVNEETLEERFAWRTHIGRIWLIGILAVALISGIVYSLIAFSPLKYTIPGYGKYVNARKLVALNKKVDDLTEEIEIRDQYLQRVQRLLKGEVTNLDDSVSNVIINKESNEIISKVEADKILRDRVNERQEDVLRDSAVSMIAVSTPQANLKLDQLYFTPPVSGTISLHYDVNRRHYGVDILAPRNTAVKATLDGYIISSDWTVETGNTICIQHSNNVLSFYKHNSTLLKKAGDFVQAGEAIAIIGNTGTLSTGPHLHFELWQNGQPLDPEQYINFN